MKKRGAQECVFSGFLMSCGQLIAPAEGYRHKQREAGAGESNLLGYRIFFCSILGVGRGVRERGSANRFHRERDAEQ